MTFFRDIRAALGAVVEVEANGIPGQRVTDDRCPTCGAEKQFDYELGGMACPNLCTFRLPRGRLP